MTTVLDCRIDGRDIVHGTAPLRSGSAQTRIYALLNISSIGLIVTRIYLGPAMINTRGD